MFQIERVPTLTICFHPDTSRIGEQVLMRQLLDGQSIELNRSSPAFAQHGAMPMPLDDSHISRSPVVLTLDDEELVVDPTATSSEVVINSEWVREELRLPLWKLNRGVTLKLADRVMLCIHYSQPGRTDTPARGLIGHGDAIDEVREMIGDLAADDDPALLLGEDGVGKTLVAKAIHEASSRGGRAFETLSLGEIPPDEVHGVLADPQGPIQQAEGGTLYVDGLSEVDDDAQGVILNLVQHGTLVDPEGAEQAMDIRVLVGSGRELEHAVSEGHLRIEFTALFAMSLHIPPLRNRIEDIAPLFLHFLRQALRDKGLVTVLQDGGPGRPLWLPPDFVGRLLRHQWPGNGSQLNAVAREIASTSGQGYTVRITKAVERYLDDPTTFDHNLGLGVPATGHTDPADVSDNDLMGALKAYRWNAVATATHLGTSVRAVYDLMDASPMFKDASRLAEGGLQAVCRQFGGDPTLSAERLQVSRRGLLRRLWTRDA